MRIQRAVIGEHGIDDPLHLHEHADDPRFRAAVPDAESEPRTDALQRSRLARDQPFHREKTACFFSHARCKRAVRDKDDGIREPRRSHRVAQHEVMQGAFDDHREEREGATPSIVARGMMLKRGRAIRYNATGNATGNAATTSVAMARHSKVETLTIYIPCDAVRFAPAVDERMTSSPGKSHSRASIAAPPNRSCRNSTARRPIS